MSQAEVFNCSIAHLCSGCNWFEKPYLEQRDEKIQSFKNFWKEAHLPDLIVHPKFISVSEMGLRDRVDLIIDRSTGQQRIGLFDRNHEQIIDITTCPQLSPELQRWFEDFRKIQWPIKRGSVRLRISPQGQRGAWLDFANVDVKTLLDEKIILKNLMNESFVEIGQRRKHLIETNERLKLIDPVFQPWFETYTQDSKTIPLKCNVASFTQPGFRANKVLVGEVLSLAKEISAKRVAEFGSGIGNFTLPLASSFDKVDAFEIDRLACDALKKNLSEALLENKVTIHQGDYQTLNERRSFDASNFDLIFVDPPRSGLKSFLDPLFNSNSRAEDFIYVSCFPESFCADSKRLYELGYELKALSIVDQFPQTPHAELVAHFQIKK